MYKKIIKVLLSTSLILSLTCISFGVNKFAFADANADAHATILFTNDVHGGISNVTKSLDSEANLCYASVAKMKQECGENTLLVDAGDHVSGSSYAAYDRGQTMTDLMMMSGYDFAVPGNHEFDRGVDYFYSIQNKVKTSSTNSYDYYACNFHKLDESGQDDGLATENDGYKIFDVANIRIALVGIMTPETMGKTAVGFYQDEDGNFRYKIDSAEKDDSLYDVVANTLDKTEVQNADIIIGVGHLGDDISSGRNTSMCLVQHVNAIQSSKTDKKGFSAFIDGHSHHVYTSKFLYNNDNDNINNSSTAGPGATEFPIMQTGTAFNNVGKLNIHRDKDGNFTLDRELVSKYGSRMGESGDNNTVLGKELAWYNKVEATLAIEVAKTDFDYIDSDDYTNPNRLRYVRTRETNLSDLITDAFYWYCNTNPENFTTNNCEGIVDPNIFDPQALAAFSSGDVTDNGIDVAIFNGGAIRETIPAGKITMQTCRTTLPYDNELAICKLTGQNIKDMIEFAVRYFGTGAQSGSFLHYAGLRAKINAETPSTVQIDEYGCWAGPPTGAYKVEDIQIYNKQTQQYEDIDPTKYYKLAGTFYMFASFGDGYTNFKPINIRKTVSNYQKLPSYVLAKYLENFNEPVDNGLPVVNSENSPLHNGEIQDYFSEYETNYENKFGSRRLFGNYAINFESNGGSAVQKQFVEEDMQVQKPDNPTKENDEFVMWCSDIECNIAYDFNTPVSDNKTLYALWGSEAAKKASSNVNATDISALSKTYDSPWLLAFLFIVLLSSSGVLLSQRYNKK